MKVRNKPFKFHTMSLNCQLAAFIFIVKMNVTQVNILWYIVNFIWEIRSKFPIVMNAIWLPPASQWVKLGPEQIWYLVWICFKSFILPTVPSKCVNGIKAIDNVPPYADT